MLKFCISVLHSLMDMAHQNQHDKELFVNSWEHYSLVYYFYTMISAIKGSLDLFLNYEFQIHVPTHLHVATVV